MAKPRDDRQKDLLRPALEEVIDLGHPLVRLAGEIDWEFLDRRFSSVCKPGDGRPPLPTRLVAGLLILKHMHSLSDEALCARSLENRYYQFFLARRHGLALRQSYRRVAKRAAIMVGRYSHAHQFKRARRELKFLRTRLGRVIRDIRRKIKGRPDLETRFADLPALAVRVRFQDHRQRDPKVYALHAPEVACIGKGKARAPYEFGCKVSVATPATRPKGGQFVLHAKALHGNPFDSHTLGPAIAELERLTGVETRRIHVDRGYVDRGYRGHNHPQKFRVWISGQVRRTTAQIRREVKRRAAVEPVIGHVKAEHRTGRNHLKGRDGDRANAVPAAAGHNFALLLHWLAGLLCALFRTLFRQSFGLVNPA